MPLNPNVPYRSELIERVPTGGGGVPGYWCAAAWLRYFQGLQTTGESTPQRLPTGPPLTGQGASIGLTALPLPSLAGGLYRVTYYARITRPGSVSSSLIVTLSWTEGTIVCSKSFPAIVGNTTDTTDSQTFTLRVDSGAPISYATTYASVGGTTMQYRLEFVVELLP